MRRDARLTAVLSAYFLPLLRATWAVDPDGIDRAEAVDLVASDLGLPILGQKTKPSGPAIRGFKWHDHARIALLNLVYGHMPFEEWFVERDGRTHLAGIGERQPHTIAIIDINDDGTVRQISQNTQNEPVAGRNLLWYVNQREGANWAGVSMLRSCYTPWILKHETMRVHATSIRRFGMGVPSVSAPPGGTPGQVQQAQQLASQMRAGDTAGVGLPSGFQYALTGLTGSVPDALGFLKYCNQEMTTSALTQLLELGTTQTGSRAVGENFLDLFLLSLQACADAIGDTATTGQPGMAGLARDLVEYNWGEGEPVPAIRATDVGDRHEITALSIQQLMAGGAIQADPALEAYVRNAWGLPARSIPWTPPPLKSGQTQPGGPGPAGGGSAPANPSPAAPSPAAPANPPAPARGPVPRETAPAAAADMRRALTPTEAAAGMDPLAIASESASAVDALMAHWEPVMRAQRHDLSEQVTAAVDDGNLAHLPAIRPDTTTATRLLGDAMTAMAWTGAQRMIREAAAQHVIINPSTVVIDDTKLRQVAAARAGLIAARYAAEAAKGALSVVTASAGTDAGDYVSVLLAGLSLTPLEDDFRAAMNAAQNTGRVAAITAGINAGHDPVCYASEILDRNTCPPCASIDGHQFATPAEAEAAYAGGAYVRCEGRLRCRGTIITQWEGGDSPPFGLAAAWDEARHPRGVHGEWVTLGYDQLDKHLAATFHPAQLEADRARHPRSGYMVEVGKERRVHQPPASAVHDSKSLGPEGPAVFDVIDHGTLAQGENLLVYPKHAGTEPIKHVYRGMSAAEWDQAQARGHIASDERGAISPLEGTNAAADPRDAVSYLPGSGEGYVAKIAVNPADKWFTIHADDYLRTRKPIPLDRVQKVARFRRTADGQLEIPRDALAPAAAWDEAKHPRGWHGRFGHGTKPGGGKTSSPGGISDAAFEARQKMVAKEIAAAAAKNTAVTETLDGHGEIYSPARAKIHNEIVTAIMTKAATVPDQGKAILGGGLPASGKTSAMRAIPGMNMDDYLWVAQDDIQEELANRGLIPKVDGLSPMECAPLVVEESRHVANMVLARCAAEHKNVIIELTMNPSDNIEQRVAILHQEGYTDVEGVYIDIPLDTSITRALNRYRTGLDAWRHGQGNGARRISPADLTETWGTSDPDVSLNEENFTRNEQIFDGWYKFDNSQYGRPPMLVDSSMPAPPS